MFKCLTNICIERWLNHGHLKFELICTSNLDKTLHLPQVKKYEVLKILEVV